MGGPSTFTADEVRAMIRARAKPCALNKGSTGVTEWCRSYGIAKAHVSEFLSGKRVGCPTDALNALGLEQVYRRKT